MDSYSMRQTIDALQQHAESVRIQKLIHLVCEQDWPRVPEKTTDLSDLLPRLLEIASTPAALRAELLQGVSTLSKRQQYTKVALVICNVLAPLYPGEANLAVADVNPKDIFELRLAVIKYTVPLNAKILIQSVLDRIFTGQRQDWISLRQTSLDELLLRLCQTYGTFIELETQLQRTVEQVKVLDQPTQTMTAILQAVRPLYADLPSSPGLMAEPQGGGTDVMMPDTVLEESGCTSQFFRAKA